MNNPRNWQALSLWAMRHPRLSPKQESFAVFVRNVLERRERLSTGQCRYAEALFAKALRVGFVPPSD